MSLAHPSNGTLAVLFIVALGIAALGVRRKRSSSLSLPPGPKGLPIIGSALDTAGGYQWLAYEKWGREYGIFCILLTVVQLLTENRSCRERRDPRLDVQHLCRCAKLYEGGQRPLRKEVVHLLRQARCLHSCIALPF